MPPRLPPLQGLELVDGASQAHVQRVVLGTGLTASAELSKALKKYIDEHPREAPTPTCMPALRAFREALSGQTRRWVAGLPC